MHWFIISLDNVMDTAATYREARSMMLSNCDDGRKHPDIKRLKPGLYRYIQSSRYPTTHREYLWIGTREALRQEGFGELIEEYEADSVERSAAS